MKKPTPGSEGRVELGTRLIDNPFDYATGRKNLVTVNVRESAIDHMRSRGRIDQTQADAGDRFRKLWELAAIGHHRGINYDGAGGNSGPGDPLTEELVKAGQELARVLKGLGKSRSSILISIVGEGKRISDVAKRWSRSGGIVNGDRAEGYVTGTLVDALDDLIELWRMEGSPVRKHEERPWWRNGEEVNTGGNIRAAAMKESGPAYEVYVSLDGICTREATVPIDRTAMTGQRSGNLGGSPPRSKVRHP